MTSLDGANALPPHWNVPVRLAMGTPEYLVVATTWHGWESESWFKEVGDLLGGRPGWHCDLTSNGILWSFGPFGASLFNLSPPDESEQHGAAYPLFDYEADEVVPLMNVDELRDWLEANEHRHQDHARNLRPLLSANDWGVLTLGSIDAEVTVGDGHWIGTVPSIPAEATFAGALSDLVVGLRELVGNAVGAPDDVVPRIRLRLTLDEAATAAAGRSERSED